MATKIDAAMSTSIALDTLKASNSISSLTKAVRGSTSAWKAQEAQLKSSGDYLKASEAKYEGLGKSIEAQQKRIETLQDKMKGIDQTTQEGAKLAVKYGTDLDKATTALKSMEAQQTRAKEALDRQKSGINDITASMGRRNAISDAYVKRLESEGNHVQALKEKRENSKKSIDDMTKALEKEESMLSKMKNDGASDSAITKQRVSVEKLKTSINQSKQSVASFDSEIHKLNPTPIDRIKSGISKIDKSSQKATHSLRNMAVGVTVGNAISNGLASAVSWIKESTKEGYALAESGKVAKRRWESVGLSSSQATKMGHQIGDIRNKSNIAGSSLANMQQKWFALTNSAPKARAMVEVVSAFGKAGGKTAEQIESISGKLARLAGSKTVSNGLFQRTLGQLPILQREIVKASGMTEGGFKKALQGGKITGDQLQKYMETASKNSGKAWTQFGKSTQGKIDAVKGTITGLKVAFATPFTNQITKSIDQISAKKGSINQFRKSISDIIGALGKNTGKFIGDAIYFIVKNKDSIGKIASSVFSIVKAFGSGVWKTISTVLGSMSKNANGASGSMQKVSKGLEAIAKHQKAIKTLGSTFVAVFAVGKLLKMASGMVTLSKNLKLVAGALKLVNLAMKTNPFVLIATAVVAIGVALYQLYKHNKKFRTMVNGWGKAIKSGWKKITKFFKDLPKTAKKAISNMGKAVSQKFREISHIVSRVWGNMTKPITDAWNRATSATSSLLGKIGKIISSIFKGFISTIGNIWGGIVSTVSTPLNAVKDVMSNIFNGIKKTVSDVIDSIVKAINDMVKTIQNAVDSVKDFGGNIFNGAKHMLGFGKQNGTIALQGYEHGTEPFRRYHLTRNAGQTAHLGGNMLVNDAPTNPYRELLLLPNGRLLYPKGRNVIIPNAPKGTEVFNAQDTKRLLAKPYATGTGSIASMPIRGLNPATSGSKFSANGNDLIKKMLDSMLKIILKFVKANKKSFSNVDKDTSKSTTKTKKRTEKQYKQLSQALDDTLKTTQKNNKNTWTAIYKDTSKRTQKIYDKTTDIFNDLSKFMSSVENTISGNWSKAWNNMLNVFQKAMNALPRLGQSGMNGAISALNVGVGNINGLIGHFGGNNSILPKISHYATGTNGKLETNELALVNDALGNNYKEVVVLPSGRMIMPTKRNMVMPLLKGSAVINGEQVNSLQSTGRLQAHAEGTLSDDQLEKMVSSKIKNPSQAWNSDYTSKVNSSRPLIQEGLTDAVKQGLPNDAVPWYQALWTVIQEQMDAGSGSRGAFLKYAIENFMGKPYLMGGNGPENYDCSGMVAAALRHFGINIGRTTTQMQTTTDHVSRSDAKPGDLTIWGDSDGANGHVGIIMNRSGRMFNETVPRAGYGNYLIPNGLPWKGLFRIRQLHDEDPNQPKVSARLKALVKKQLGSKALEWIQNKFNPTPDVGSSPGGEYSPSLIRRAAKAMRANASDNFIRMLQGVISSESGGRNIVQQIHDSNSGGNEARGILQFTPPTFNNFAMSGHHNIMNLYDQLLAFFNNSDWLHSIGMTTIWGHTKMDWLHSGPIGHRRFANGGIANEASIFGENGAEMAIPLSATKSDRANQLLGETVVHLAKNSPDGALTPNVNNQNDNKVIDELTQLNKTAKNLISLTKELIIATIKGSFDKDLLYKIQGQNQSIANFQSL